MCPIPWKTATILQHSAHSLARIDSNGTAKVLTYRYLELPLSLETEFSVPVMQAAPILVHHNRIHHQTQGMSSFDHLQPHLPSGSSPPYSAR